MTFSRIGPRAWPMTGVEIGHSCNNYWRNNNYSREQAYLNIHDMFLADFVESDFQPFGFGRIGGMVFLLILFWGRVKVRRDFGTIFVLLG